MKRWPVDVSSLSGQALRAGVVHAVMSGIGTPQLARCFLAAMQDVLPVTFCTVFAANASGGIETISAASSYGDTAERTAERYVAERFDRLDPHLRWLARRALPEQAQLWMGHLLADDIADAAYRAACYGDVGIRERVSVLQLLPTGQRAAVSFYRSLAQPDFTSKDFELIAQHAGLLADATAADARGTRTRPPAATTIDARMQSLGLREREVVGHLLTGKTARETAHEMGVALTTVRTHQYRAFRRLGISGLKALLRGG